MAGGEPENVYVVGDQIYRSNDGGSESWEVANVGLRRDGAVPVAVAPSDPDILYTFYPLLGVLRSTDQGRTWHSATGDLDQQGAAGSLVVHPRDPSTVYIVLTGNLYRTVDGGETWDRLAGGGEGRTAP